MTEALSPTGAALTIATDLERTLCDLADIAYSSDVTLKTLRHKAARVYESLRSKYPINVCDALETQAQAETAAPLNPGQCPNCTYLAKRNEELQRRIHNQRQEIDSLHKRLDASRTP